MIVARKRINRVFYNWMLKSDVNHIVRVHGGLHIKIKLSDQACSSILCERRYSPAEARVFLRLASRCGSIIYVGANYGYFTLLALANSDPGCQVVAIGPNEVLAGMIEDSVALNEFEGVTVIVAAAGKENGVDLFDVDESLSSSEGSEEAALDGACGLLGLVWMCGRGCEVAVVAAPTVIVEELLHGDGCLVPPD